MESRRLKEQTSKSNERIGFEARLERIETFLRPPYTFKLPPSNKKLMIGDVNYNIYMCRNSVIMPLLNEIESLFKALENAHSFIKKSDDQKVVKGYIDALFDEKRSSHNIFPTQDILDSMKERIISSVNIMEDAIEASK